MSGFDREDYRGLVERKRERLAVTRRRELEQARYSGLSAKYVTGDAHWDAFCRQLEQWKGEAEAERDDLIEKFQLSAVVNPDALVAQKLAVQVARERIGVLEQVLDLPRQLIENGAEATETLAKSTDSGEETAH